ncbi:MAG: alanine racemase, partial [Casimicrobiaceae bacterium]
MAQRRPARVGDPVGAIETPALVVDLDPFERNLDKMAQATRGIRLRPHAKSHKCAEIARMQVARGAVGICCQKTDEAEAFVAAGIRDVLVTNEVVAPAKLARLAALARSATIGVLVDSPALVPLLGAVAARESAVLDVY